MQLCIQVKISGGARVPGRPPGKLQRARFTAHPLPAPRSPPGSPTPAPSAPPARPKCHSPLQGKQQQHLAKSHPKEGPRGYAGSPPFMVPTPALPHGTSAGPGELSAAGGNFSAARRPRARQLLRPPRAFCRHPGGARTSREPGPPWGGGEGPGDEGGPKGAEFRGPAVRWGPGQLGPEP